LDQLVADVAYLASTVLKLVWQKVREIGVGFSQIAAEP